MDFGIPGFAGDVGVCSWWLDTCGHRIDVLGARRHVYGYLSIGRQMHNWINMVSAFLFSLVFSALSRERRGQRGLNGSIYNRQVAQNKMSIAIRTT